MNSSNQHDLTEDEKVYKTSKLYICSVFANKCLIKYLVRFKECQYATRPRSLDPHARLVFRGPRLTWTLVDHVGLASTNKVDHARVGHWFI